jgi:8-oxo-dGTP pyrophosphatase MutT (NUDIX family)
VFGNPWFEVYEDRVTNPGGGQNDYGHIRFLNRAVGIIPVDADGQTWLVGQERYTLGKWSWEIPKGGAPLDEPLKAAALRELKEETGLAAARIGRIATLDMSNSVTDEIAHIYLAAGLTPGTPDPEETEYLELRRLPLAEAVAMALDGAISDAVSVCGLQRLGLTPGVLETDIACIEALTRPVTESP